jgi:hypothetical protein
MKWNEMKYIYFRPNKDKCLQYYIYIKNSWKRLMSMVGGPQKAYADFNLGTRGLQTDCLIDYKLSGAGTGTF